jgi:hypothetical protein
MRRNNVRSNLSIIFMTQTPPDPPETTPFNCTPAEIELLKTIRNENVSILIKAMLSIHDIAVYHSDIPLGKTERLQLLHIRLLADAMQEIEKEG